MVKKSLEIDMIAGSQLRDTQGEMLSVEGADISELEAGRGRLNDNHGKGFFNSIGRITGAKKIFSEADCETDRHRYYWEKVKSPFIYVQGKLYDDDDHPNARAAAAILRNIHKSDCPLRLKASVEGGVVARGMKDSNLLARTKIHSVALTFTPANQATLVEPTSMQKSQSWDEDSKLIRSVVHLAKSDVPSFRHITRHASAEKLMENLNKIKDIASSVGIEIQMPYSDAADVVHSSITYKLKKNIEQISSIIKEAKQAEDQKKMQQFTELFKSYVEMRKAVPKPDTHAYNLGMDKPDGGKYDGYTGKDAKKAQLHALKTAMNNEVLEGNHVKMMDHLETGKREPHILVHHGINHKTGDATGTASKRPKEAGNHNVFTVEDGIVNHPSFGVHTLYHSVADEYTNNLGDDHEFKDAGVKGHMRQFEDGDQWGYEDTHDSGVHSFWVPVSGLHSMRTYEDSRFKNKQFPLPEGYYNKDHHEDETEAREEISDDPHADEQKHIVIRPGKYRQASYNDLKELHEKAQNDPNGYSRSPFENNRRYFTKDGVIENGKKVNLEKALTAGYGGAGSATDRIGGSVLQSESLDDGFKYITCKNCGHEQVYMANQVKCRDCKHSLSFEDLLRTMI
jgi:hypothetical protein